MSDYINGVLQQDSSAGTDEARVIELIAANANKLTLGDSFPANPQEDALHYFTAQVSGLTWKDPDQTTDRTIDAYEGNLARFNGTDWYFFHNFRTLIELLAAAAQRDIPRVYFQSSGLPSSPEQNDYMIAISDYTLTGTAVRTTATDTTRDVKRGNLYVRTHTNLGNYWLLLGNIGGGSDFKLTFRTSPTFPANPSYGEYAIFLETYNTLSGGATWKEEIDRTATFVHVFRGAVFQYQEDTSGTLSDAWVRLGTVDRFMENEPFEGLPIQRYARSSSKTLTDGQYYADEDEVIITNNTARPQILETVATHPLEFRDEATQVRRYFIVSEVDDSDSDFVRFVGYWGGGPTKIVTTGIGDDTDIFHIPHNGRIGLFVDPADLDLDFENTTFGDSLPSDAVQGSNVVFLEAVASGLSWKDFDGTNRPGSAEKGDVAQRVILNNNLEWVYLGNIGTPDASSLALLAARVERVAFDAVSQVGSTRKDAPIQSSNGIAVAHGNAGLSVLGSATGANAFTVLNRGVYICRFSGSMDMRGSGTRRVTPKFILTSGGTDVLEVIGHYHRTSNNENNRHFNGMGMLIVPTNNYVVSVQAVNNLTADAGTFNLDDGWRLDVAPIGVKGDKGEGKLQAFATGTGYEVDTIVYGDVGSFRQYYQVTSAILDTNADDLATLIAAGTLRLISRPTTTKVTTELAFPDNPESFDINVFPADVDSGLDYFDTDLTTQLTSASLGDVVQYLDFGLGITGWYKLDFSWASTDLTDILQRLALLEAPEATNPINAFGPEWARSPEIGALTPTPVAGAFIKYGTDRWTPIATVQAAVDALVVPAHDATTSPQIDYAFDLPIDYEAPEHQIGWWLVASEGTERGHSPLFLPLAGEVNPEAERLEIRDAAADATSDGDLPYFEVYWEKLVSESGVSRLRLALADNGVSIPSGVVVSFYPAFLAGNFTSGGSQQQDPGTGSIAFVTEDLIQLTQWIRSTTEPAEPRDVTYIPSSGDFEGFVETGWANSVADTTGSDQLWMATGTLTRNEDGTWNQLTEWTVMSEASSLIRFYNSETGQYQDHASGFISFAEIYTLDRGWVSIPIVGRNLIYDGDVTESAWVTLPSIYLYRIDRLRFNITHGNQRASVEMSGYALWGDSPHVISDGQTILHKQNANSETFLIRWGTTGIATIQRIGSNTPPETESFDGGILCNIYRDDQNRLRDFVKFSNYGYTAVSPHSIKLQIIAFTR